MPRIINLNEIELEKITKEEFNKMKSSMWEEGLKVKRDNPVYAKIKNPIKVKADGIKGYKRLIMDFFENPYAWAVCAREGNKWHRLKRFYNSKERHAENLANIAARDFMGNNFFEMYFADMSNPASNPNLQPLRAAAKGDNGSYMADSFYPKETIQLKFKETGGYIIGSIIEVPKSLLYLVSANIGNTNQNIGKISCVYGIASPNDLTSR